MLDVVLGFTTIDALECPSFAFLGSGWAQNLHLSAISLGLNQVYDLGCALPMVDKVEVYECL